jgi:hypothetical protein
MDIWSSFSRFARFCVRVTVSHFATYVVVGGASYMLIMRHCWPNLPADLALWDITSPHVQLWIWPAQFFRGAVLAAAFYPFREALLKMGRLGGLAIAGVMIGIGCLAGFNGLLENLVFYRNASLYLYYIHIPEVLAQTLSFGYLLMMWERAASRPEPQPFPA